MIVDFLRSCYTTTAHFFAGDLTIESDLTWYFAPPGAKFLPFPTAFASRNWDSRLPGTNVLGEVIGASRHWYNGSRPPFASGDGLGTNASSFVAMNGCPLPAVPYTNDDRCGEFPPVRLSGAGRGVMALPVGLPPWPPVPFPPPGFPPIVVPILVEVLGGLGTGKVIRRIIRGSGILGGRGLGSLVLVGIGGTGILGGLGRGIVSDTLINGRGILGGLGHGLVSKYSLPSFGGFKLCGCPSGLFIRNRIGRPGSFLGVSGSGDVGTIVVGGSGAFLGGSGEGDLLDSDSLVSTGILGGLGTGDVVRVERFAFAGTGTGGSVASTVEQQERFAFAGTGTGGSVASTVEQQERFAFAGTGTAGTVAATYTDTSVTVDSFDMAGTGTAGTVAAVYREFPVTTGCTQCNPSPSNWQFTLSGVTNNVCSNCANFNATFTLAYVTGCTWESSSPAVDCGSAGAVRWRLQYISASSLWRLSQLSGGPGNGTGSTWELAAGSWQCLSSNTLARVTSGTSCTGFPANITITPH